MGKHERLKNWIDTLNPEQMKKVILELTDFAIDAEEVSFWTDTTAPYWSNSGENLDGTDRKSEDEDEIDTPF